MLGPGHLSAAAVKPRGNRSPCTCQERQDFGRRVWRQIADQHQIPLVRATPRLLAADMLTMIRHKFNRESQLWEVE